MLPDSPTLQRIARGDLSEGELWARVAREGAPLGEALDGERGHRLVTFVFRGTAATRNAVVVGGPGGFDVAGNRMQRLGDSELWFRSYRMEREARCLYEISENDSLTPPWEMDLGRGLPSVWAPDPLNPGTTRWSRWRGGATAGRCSSFRVRPRSPTASGGMSRAGRSRGSV